MKKSVMILISLMLVLAMALSGCGSAAGGEKVPALKAGEALELTNWSMNATAWSSPNGATVNLKAIPNGYAEGQKAVFCVRLEGEDIASVECSWDGSAYTASADLNGADGYCYYVQLTAADGTQTEVAVNTPTDPFDKSLIHMATALNAYCEASVSDFEVSGGKLTIKDGQLMVQLPWLTLDEGPVTCSSAALVLSHNGTDIATQTLSEPKAENEGICRMDLSGISFDVPGDIEDDHQLGLRLDVTLSNGYSLSAPAGNWYYLDGQLLLAVG